MRDFIRILPPICSEPANTKNFAVQQIDNIKTAKANKSRSPFSAPGIILTSMALKVNKKRLAALFFARIHSGASPQSGILRVSPSLRAD